MDYCICLKSIRSEQLIVNGLLTSVFKAILINLGNTLNEDDFQGIVYEAISRREEYILKKHGMEIETDPRIVNALEKTSMISSRL